MKSEKTVLHSYILIAKRSICKFITSVSRFTQKIILSVLMKRELIFVTQVFTHLKRLRVLTAMFALKFRSNLIILKSVQRLKLWVQKKHDTQNWPRTHYLEVKQHEAKGNNYAILQRNNVEISFIKRSWYSSFCEVLFASEKYSLMKDLQKNWRFFWRFFASEKYSLMKDLRKNWRFFEDLLLLRSTH